MRRITLDHPEKRNALDAQLKADLFQVLDAAVRSPDTRVVVLAGAGKSFCSGADLKPTREPPGGARPSVRDAAGDMARNRERVAKLTLGPVEQAGGQLDLSRDRKHGRSLTASSDEPDDDDDGER